MKFYLTTIKNDSQSITPYVDSDSAMAAYHHEMEYAYNAKIATTCYVTDNMGHFIQQPTHYEERVEQSDTIGLATTFDE